MNDDTMDIFDGNDTVCYTSFLESLVFLNKYKNLLHITGCNSNDDNEYCTEEIQRINEYIEKWCKHETVIDYFETDLEFMQKIKYCKHCDTEFK